MFYFQPEDEWIEKYATGTFDYRLPKQQATDSRRVFFDSGIDPSRRIMVVESSKMKALVYDITTSFADA